MVSKEPLWRRAIARINQAPAQRLAFATTAGANASA